ncbi:YvcK family protein [Kocuria palustris]|nr:YvcK family protein [Kocuria palustris]
MRLAVFSGGTATNELVGLFGEIFPQITYIIPISDNGGSTSELIRVIGGPAIGDIRSRLTRLIPPHQDRLRNLLSFRLSKDPKDAKDQWADIVDGTHPIWQGILPSTKELIRSFFIHVNVELLKRLRPPSAANATKLYRFELANLGNLFLTGVRLFVGSLDSAIELFSRITGIDPNVEVFPCINTNFSYHILALLENGNIITGQLQISHPSLTTAPDVYPPPFSNTQPPLPQIMALTPDVLSPPVLEFGIESDSLIMTPSTPIPQINVVSPARRLSEGSVLSSDDEAGNLPQYIHPELKKSQLHFSKCEDTPLLSPIKRIFYILPYGQEICPIGYARATALVTNCDVLVYSIGSLMTLIVPIIILRNMGKAIVTGPARKILLLNGCTDRETAGMAGEDFVRAIVDAARYLIDNLKLAVHLTGQWDQFVTDIVYLEHGIPVNTELLEHMGVKCHQVEGRDVYNEEALKRVLIRLTSPN